MLEKDAEFYRKLLGGDECVCGNYKQPQYPLCPRCYFSIDDEDLRVRLFNLRRNISEFAELFDAACIQLSEKGFF